MSKTHFINCICPLCGGRLTTLQGSEPARMGLGKLMPLQPGLGLALWDGCQLCLQ